MKELDLTKVQEYLEQGADFVVEQAPLVAQEILLVGRLQYTLGASAALVALLVTAVVLYKAIRRMSKGFNYVDNDEMPCVFALLISGFLFGISGCLLVQATVAALTAWFAPRLYIFEQMKGLL